MIIDFENHMFMERQVLQGSSKSGKVYESYWDTNGKIVSHLYEEASHVDKYLQFMDDAGIDMAVLTNQRIGSLDEVRGWNDFCSQVVRENPKRFAGFANTLPLGGKPAFEELERAVSELGLKGVHIFTRVEGRMLDSRELWPFYEKVSELKIPIDVHVTTVPDGFDALRSHYPLHFVIAREMDMCAATFRICLGGVLEDFPDLVFIMNHFGGGISAVLERLDYHMSHAGPGRPNFYFDKPLISKPWRENFDKLYFNMAGREVGIDSVKCALTNISPRKLLFGTDWPFNFDYHPEDVKRYIEEIRKLELPEADIEAILGGNGAKLLGI